jgi:Acyclic terpene utilisation family protein AtuA
VSSRPAKDVVRLGLWAAFWGDTPRALRQLLRVPELDYLVSDYLAEITMALLARARAKDPSAGYVQEAVDTLGPVLAEIGERGLKVVTNAGALNAPACAAALQQAADGAGAPLRVAAVVGDDLMPRLPEILAGEPRDMFTGEALPAAVSSLNAYLGARPIAAALDAGADVVVTGRCVDAAVVLGPLLHEFGWAEADYDRLAGGVLAGHIIECGPQCTGGLSTDWDEVPGWEDMGYPIAEVGRDGTAVITKPPGTGGRVSVATVGEQVVYEIGDPGAYITPDVVCDWRGVELEQAGEDRVRVRGARGSAPTSTYKVTATAQDGYRSMTMAMFAGVQAGGRARRFARDLVARTERLLAQDGLAPLSESSIEIVGAGDAIGAGGDDATLEAVAKIGVRHPDRAALEVFAAELAPMALVAQGMTGFFGGRPRVSPVFRVLHLLVDKAATPARVHIGEEVLDVSVAPGQDDAVVATPPLASATDPASAPAAGGGGTVTVALKQLAYARSGDKGDRANIGLIARRPELVPLIREQVTAARVAALFAHHEPSRVTVWELPGMHAFNFLLDDVLGGSGGTSTLRFDAQGKSYAAMLLALEVTVPDGLTSDEMTTTGRRKG